MERAFLETIFLCGIALLGLLELYYLQNHVQDKSILAAQKKKRFLLLLLMAGMQIVPFLYLFSVDFGPTDYHLWKWLTFPVTVVYIFFIWLFIRALSDLGKWWTPGQELKEDLELVRSGAYFYVRHPMYASIIGIAVCQLFMLQNFVAGPASLILVAPFCIYQIRREERMLTRFFGDDYTAYCRNTGMLWPKDDKIPFIKKVISRLLKEMKVGLLFVWKQSKKIFRKESV